MRLIADRGLARGAPENSLGAFAAALSAGFQGIKTEVRLTADGEAVLFGHRLSCNGLPVQALTRAELSQAQGYLVPTLSEAVDAFPEAFWMVTLTAGAAAPAVFSLLQQLGMRREIVITSLRHELALRAAELGTSECGLTVCHRPAALNALLYAAMPHRRLRSLIWDYEAVDAPLLQQANALGFRNYVYGAQSEAEHMLCHSLALRGLITASPECAGLTPPPPLQ
ncbi:glycerophosphodiester phosphodiesterase [Chitiniphilus purpureus]|uniref:Glycerophosphodiester phosphodiesterase n=1 Tax=Chitiniphilus purpureus TaxID=2981137 RepID=A0ABY6DI21_9NEIS|nr:glycerophosphodiester phosphodiesterase [Chitiniphilus sp. CD1]UXY13995.1 glycerophosphodiester phosphodiesterase [Chitiniphilus sp. CD1]